MTPDIARDARFNAQLLTLNSQLSKQPWLCAPPLHLERLDLVGVLQREPDFVEAVQQGVFAKRIDFELEDLSAWRGHALLFEVDHQTIAGCRVHLLEQPIDGLGIEPYQQQAVFKTVVEKDVGETRRDHRLKT